VALEEPIAVPTNRGDLGHAVARVEVGLSGHVASGLGFVDVIVGPASIESPV